MASQPVGRPQNLGFAKWCADVLQGRVLRWWGFNQMTDGSISVGEADVLGGYEAGAFGGDATQLPDYDNLKRQVLAADAEGFGYSLHAQGDAAVRRSIDIFDQCLKNSEGRLVHRFAITDLEMTEEVDLDRMASLGIAAEVYPQVPSLRTPSEAIELAARQVGGRATRYWNRRGMLEAGVTVACATDFPLLVPSLGEAALYACILPLTLDDGPYSSGNALTGTQLLSAWTSGGAVDLGLAGAVGTLEHGARADFAVYRLEQHAPSLEQGLAGGEVLATYVDGEKVWAK